MAIITTNFVTHLASENIQQARPHDMRDAVPTSPKMKQILTDYWVSDLDRRIEKSTKNVLEWKRESVPKEFERQNKVAGSR